MKHTVGRGSASRGHPLFVPITSKTAHVHVVGVPILPPDLARMTGYCLPFNILKPTGHVMHQQFNIQQLYALPTLYLCVLCLSENKQRLVPLTA